MPKFACEFCESKIRVPDEFVGKRVKCPGCSKAITVPGAAADGGMDLSLLEDSSEEGASASPRKLRSIAIGCGACNRTIHLAENLVGTITPCPKCRTPLRVDRLELPATTGSTINLKHIELEPVGEPSLLGGDTQLGGSLAGLTGTGRSGSSHLTGGMSAAGGSVGGAVGGGMGGPFAGNAQDQMQELRQLNDLKASGAISDDAYRQRKAAIYSGSSESSGAARKAMSRSASGATEKALFVDMTSTIPGPLKALIVVGVVGLLGFLVWEFGIRPALWDMDSPTQLASEKAQAQAEADRKRRESGTANGHATQETETQVQAEPAPPAWFELMPDLGEEALTVAMVMPGVPGVYTPPQELEVPDTPDEGMNRPTPTPRQVAPPPDSGKHGRIAFWKLIAPDSSLSHPMRHHSAFTRTLTAGTFEATVGVGIGPRVLGLNDSTFLKYQADIRQSLYNGLARETDFGEIKPQLLDDKPQTINGVGFFEVIVPDRANGRRISVLTGVQEGYAVIYWFAGPNRLYKTWQRDAVGNATIE